jgi:PAS domain S-box-containing protein
MSNSASGRSLGRSIRVSNIDIEWDPSRGACLFEKLPVAMMWVDTTLAGVMSGVQAMVGTQRFLLALQSEGRKSVEEDWRVISSFRDFAEGFEAIANIAAVAGWGNWALVHLDEGKKECRFRVTDNWEGRYQKALGVCWGSGMLAGKMAGYCSRLFDTNCWADQISFIARGDAFDEFVVGPSPRSIEQEIEGLLAADEATRADMAVALEKLGREIAERRATEVALRESEEKFRNLVEATSDWIWETDAEGNYTYSSPRVRDLLGYEPGEVVGRKPFDFMPGEEAGRITEKFRSYGAARLPFFNLENANVRKDGRRVILETSGVPRLDSRGQLLGYRGIDRDITERKQAEESLREKEEFIRAMLETSRDWIWAIDLGGAHTYSNPAVKDILGYAVEEIVGASAFHLICEEDREQVNTMVGRCIEQKRGWSGSVIRWRHKDGDCRYLESNSVPVLNPAGNVIGFRGVDRDITERMRAEEERLNLERRLLHGQKLESLGVLAGGIAHDFNNLLMAILGNLDIANSYLPPTSPAHENVGQAILATRRATDLTREMLAYSGRGRFVVTRLDLSALVRENAKLLRTVISKMVTLELALAPDGAYTDADPGQIQQVIMNLITNASEAIGDRPGRIGLSTGVLECDPNYLSHSRLAEKPPQGRFAYLEVSDTGTGMDEETQKKLFDPFFTTKFMGRGLGMSAVLGIVRGHHGAIILDSSIGKGTVFRVLFPARERKKTASPESTGVSPSGLGLEGAARTILIVDDEESVCRLLLRFVEQVGFRGITAPNGEQALRLLKEHGHEIALVLLDLTMPHMNGVTAFQEMKRIRPNVRVILTSGYDEQEAISKLTVEGLAGFIQKPYHLEDLKDKIAQLLGSSTGGTPGAPSG